MPPLFLRRKDIWAAAERGPRPEERKLKADLNAGFVQPLDELHQNAGAVARTQEIDDDAARAVDRRGFEHLQALGLILLPHGLHVLDLEGDVVDAALAAEGPTFCEIFTDTQQVWEPKSATKRLPDGTLVSPPLEDLAPFLPREELEKQMFIPLVPEG